MIGVAATAAPAAARPATATAKARAIMLEPLTLLNTAPLSFGNISPGIAGGTITVTPLDRPIYVGGATAMGGTVGAARFTISVPSAKTILVGTPKTPITLTRVGGGPTMRVTAFTDLARKVRVERGRDVYEFAVGGTLTLAANQAEGVYEGQVPVTFDYK